VYERLAASFRQTARAAFRGFLPKLFTSALTTFVVSALFAQLAPERPIAAPPAAAPAPVERLWPREPDLPRVFSFSPDATGRPLPDFTLAQAASFKPAADVSAPAAPARVARTKPRTAQRAVAAASMLPPARPATIETSAPIAVVAEPAAAPEPKPVRLLGMTLPGWVPTGEAVVNTVAALGGAVRDRLSF